MTWIDINEQKPEHGSVILVMLSEGVVRTSYFNIKFQDRTGRPWVGCKVTHWMPLPDPPKKVRWMPKDGEIVYVLCADGSSVYVRYDGLINKINHSYCGVYKTKEQAASMRDKIKAFVTSEIGECE